MREVDAFEAQTDLLLLLDDVERGESIVITRDGRAIARLIPDVQKRQLDFEAAIEAIKALRERTGKATLQELLDARHEGHKY